MALRPDEAAIALSVSRSFICAEFFPLPTDARKGEADGDR